MTDTVLFKTEGHIAHLVLNNPDRHNSLGESELAALQDYTDRIAAAEQLRVLVLTGAGAKTFCAGAALHELGSGRISSDFFQATTDKIANLKIPTICALNGNVFGGGVELALSCDFRIGVEGTRLRVPAAQIGLCYPLSGMQRFVERLGVNLAKRILMAAEEFDAPAMLHIGFLDHLVSRPELEPRTAALAENIAGLAPLAVQAMKQILAGAEAGQAQQLAAICADSADLQEGFAAQREKRPPVFSGR